MVIFYIFLRNLAKLEWQRLFFLSVYSVMFPCWGCNVNVMLALLSTSCKAFWPDVLQLQCEAADLHLSKPSRIIQEKKKKLFQMNCKVRNFSSSPWKRLRSKVPSRSTFLSSAPFADLTCWRWTHQHTYDWSSHVRRADSAFDAFCKWKALGGSEMCLL